MGELPDGRADQSQRVRRETTNTCFWRTYDRKELDYVEEREGRLFGYEFKSQGKVRSVVREEFVGAYQGAEVQTITRENYSDFLT